MKVPVFHNPYLPSKAWWHGYIPFYGRLIVAQNIVDQRRRAARSAGGSYKGTVLQTFFRIN